MWCFFYIQCSQLWWDLYKLKNNSREKNIILSLSCFHAWCQRHDVISGFMTSQWPCFCSFGMDTGMALSAVEFLLLSMNLPVPTADASVMPCFCLSDLSNTNFVVCKLLFFLYGLVLICFLINLFFIDYFCHVCQDYANCVHCPGYEIMMTCLWCVPFWNPVFLGRLPCKEPDVFDILLWMKLHSLLPLWTCT